MDLKKAGGLGLLFWIIMFGADSFIKTWFAQTGTFKVWVAIFAGILCYVFSQYIKIDTYSDALLLGVVIVGISISMDVVVASRYNPQIFSFWQTWLSYALAMLAPCIRLFRFG